MLQLEKRKYLNSTFQLNLTKYEKKLSYKIVYYINIYKFESQNLFIICEILKIFQNCSDVTLAIKIN